MEDRMMVIVGIFAFIGLVVFVLQAFLNQRTIKSLTVAINQAEANNKALDLLEPLATKVVPVELVRSANKGADFLQSLTNDEGDALIEAMRRLINKATDGQPNIDPAAAA